MNPGAGLRPGLLVVCSLGAVVSAAVLADTVLDHSLSCRGILQYLDNRWSTTLGIDGADAPPGAIAQIVDRTIGDLSLSPKSMHVVRGEDVRNLGRSADDLSAPSTQGPTGCAAPSGATPYARQAYSLLRTLRIIAACNLALFLVIALLVTRSRAKTVDYLVPAAVLTAAALASTVIYIASRDWFWSVVDGTYACVGYLLILGVVVGLLADIVWNGSRVMRLILRLLWWVPV